MPAVPVGADADAHGVGSVKIDGLRICCLGAGKLGPPPEPPSRFMHQCIANIAAVPLASSPEVFLYVLTFSFFRRVCGRPYDGHHRQEVP